MSIQIRSYVRGTDRAAAFQLWEAALGDTWPLFPEGFYATIDPQAEHHHVAEVDGQFLGLIALSRDGQEKGSIVAILVNPNRQRASIESTLLEAGAKHLGNLGVRKLRYGGGQSYFWPGVPTDQPQMIELLKRSGWQAGGLISDMVGELATSHVPEEITARIANSGAQLRLATAQDGPEILAFEEQHFPQWLPTATRAVGQEDFANMLLAELDGTIVGTNFLTSPGGPDFLWRRMLGEDSAAYGAIGVSEAARGRYIGYALAVRAAEILRERGAKRIFLGWVFSTEWYGRLGFRVWRTYQQMDKHGT
jgi:N-acetylglutamate synthase-like GNAT family acetyltransferase